ncbi:GNAT family N-acetyltransferase [Rhizobiales bacterium L72]|uniref:GNAT family N-acetyltransferase n=2 Tax=Propylenella binzhouense TaxID=2555902 RepID=A0A964T4V0_9HYPH|nr:GNAT family N-acetyltransferase [Propylenella binzhouense]MYZ47532.1 GNAT family N-acetyltransferase [Propylenella binzhouense]
MGAGDLPIALGWAAEEGWNPGLGDAAPFRAADPDGFLMARLDGEPVACISVVAYGAAYGFLGFYICRKGWRGRGYGYATWRAGLDRLGARTVGLDGVLAQQDAYRREGFDLAHRNIRFGGRPAVPPASAEEGLVAIEGGIAEAVIAADRRWFGAERPAFLAAWLAPGPTRQGLALLRAGEIAGYGVIRDCGTGAKIGPLFAADRADAERLFAALAATRPGREIFLDVPEPNRAAVALAEAHGLAPVFETARMYRGAPPALPLPAIFGITTFELG